MKFLFGFELFFFLLELSMLKLKNNYLGKTNQGRMDDFFKTSKIVSTTKQTPKRKGGKQKGTPAKKMKKK